MDLLLKIIIIDGLIMVILLVLTCIPLVLSIWFDSTNILLYILDILVVLLLICLVVLLVCFFMLLPTILTKVFD